MIASEMLQTPWLKPGVVLSLSYDAVVGIKNDVAGQVNIINGKGTITFFAGCAATVAQSVECVAHEIGHLNREWQPLPNHVPSNPNDPVYDYGRRARELYEALRNGGVTR